MKRVLVRFIPVLLLVLIMAACIMPEAQAYTPLPDSVYLWQLERGTCTIWSAAMMMRAKAYLSGCSNWADITAYTMQNVAWVNGIGLNGAFTYSFSGNSISVGSRNYNGLTLQNVRELLYCNPEGFTLYCGKIPHAVFVTDMIGDTVYCVDPSVTEKYHGKRLPLDQCTLVTVYGSQQAILDNVTKIWYVTSASFQSPDTTPPTIITAEARNITSTGYDVFVQASDNIGIVKMSFGTWHDKMSVDDAQWMESPLGASEVLVHISTEDFGGVTDTVYHTNVYVFDYNFNHPEGTRAADAAIGNQAKPEKKWTTSSTVSPGDATLSATLSIPYASILGGLTADDQIEDVHVRITPQEEAANALTSSLFGVYTGSVYSYSLSVPTMRLNGNNHCYDFVFDHVSRAANLLASPMTLTPGTTYYYTFSCKVKGSFFCSSVDSFTLPAGDLSFDAPYANDNGELCGVIRYDSTAVTLQEAGLLISANANDVYQSSIDSLASGVERARRTSGLAYSSSFGGTLAAFHSNTLSTSLQSGFTYYYRIYAVDNYGRVAYSPVSSYTVPGAQLYQLAVNYTEGGFAAQSGSGTYAAGNQVTLVASAYDGYRFSGWTATGGTLADPGNTVTAFTMPSGQATVTAHFEKPLYKLTVTNANPEGGAYIGPFYYTSDQQLKDSFCAGDTVDVYATVSEGYQFAGWSSDWGDIFADASAAMTSLVMPAGPVEVYCAFEPKEYVVTAESSQGGTASVDRQIAFYGSAVSAHAEAMDGYVFDHWESEDVELQTDGDTASFAMPSHDVTVKAVFRPYMRFETVTEETMWLPSSLYAIEEDAFQGVSADYFVCSDQTRVIGKHAFPEGAVVYIHRADLMQIDPWAISGNGYFIELGDAYCTDFVYALEGTTNAYCLMDASMPGFYTEWTPWTEWIEYENENDIPAQPGEYLELETCTQWASAPVTYVTRYTDWSSWGAWTFNRESIPDASLKEEQSRTVYQYCYFQCPSCGWHSGYYNVACEKCGTTVPNTSWHEGVWLPYSSSECSVYNGNKLYKDVDGQRYFYWSTAPQTTAVQYSYRTRSTYQDPVTGTYGPWSDTQIAPSSTVSVKTRKLYHIRWRSNLHAD